MKTITKRILILIIFLILTTRYNNIYPLATSSQLQAIVEAKQGLVRFEEKDGDEKFKGAALTLDQSLARSIEFILRPDVFQNVSMCDRATGQMEYNGQTYPYTVNVMNELEKLDQLLDVFAFSIRENKKVVSFIPHDNLTFNDNFVGYKNGEFYYPIPFHNTSLLKDIKEKYLAQTYTCFFVYKNQSRNFRYDIDKIQFVQREDHMIPTIQGKERPDIMYAVSGQMILKQPKQLSFRKKSRITDEQKEKILKKRLEARRKHIANLIEQGAFQDLRHIFALPKFDKNTQIKIIDENKSTYPKDKLNDGYFWALGQLLNDPQLRKQAYFGPVNLQCKIIYEGNVECKISQEIFDQVVQNYNTKYHVNYIKVERPEDVKRPGQYAYVGTDEVKIYLHHNKYPHSMIGITQNGNPVILAWTGLSGRVGTTIEGAAELAEKRGAQKAILLSNGGTAHMFYNGEYVVPSSENRRYAVFMFLVTEEFQNQQEKEEYYKKLLDCLLKNRIQEKEKLSSDKYAERLKVLCEEMKKTYEFTPKQTQELNQYIDVYINKLEKQIRALQMAA